jgi:hypothetical protein
MDSTASQTSAGSHICICSDLFELVEKQRIQLNEKDKQLQVILYRQANEVNASFITIINTILLHFFQELLANMDLEKAQAIEAATNQLDRDLATAQQTILTFQMATW